MTTTSMQSTATGTRAQLSLSTGNVLEGDEGPHHYVSQREFGVYRATKSVRLINECADLVTRGGIAALVPASARHAYLEAIAEQVERFARTRRTSGGILALPTSGSTGAPKLVAIPAVGLTHFLAWGGQFFNFDEATISLSLSPWNFDVSLLDTWAVLAAGGTVVAADTARLYDTSYLAKLLRRHQPTFIQVVPATLDALLGAADSGLHAAVRDVVLTGGAAAQPVRAAATQLFPEATFHNIYGSTEVNDCLVETLSAEEFGAAESLPLGRAIAGCDVVLKAGESSHPLDTRTPDIEGELLVRTPWMAIGYIDAGAITPLPVDENQRYAMKDRASWVDQELWYLGRYDRTVKIRGQRVSLDEIEQAAQGSGLAAMACAWMTDGGAGQELHLAYTVASHVPSALASLELRIAMSAKLPPFAMPNHFHLRTRPFPLNGNGKPDVATIKLQIESE